MAIYTEIRTLPLRPLPVVERLPDGSGQAHVNFFADEAMRHAVGVKEQVRLNLPQEHDNVCGPDYYSTSN